MPERPGNAGCRGDTRSTIHGWDASTIENRRVRLTVLQGKGAEVIEFLYKPLDVDLTYRTARGLRDRAAVVQAPSDPQNAFTDQYAGGWQEILPNGGAASRYRGAVLPQHAETPFLPFTAHLQRTDDSVALECRARTTTIPLAVERTFTLTGDHARLECGTTVTNLTRARVPLSWGNHFAFGTPFLTSNSTIVLPAGTTYRAHHSAAYPAGRRIHDREGVWPDAHDADGASIDLSLAPAPGTLSELLYLEPTEGWYEVRGAEGLVVRVEWDLSVQPFLWFWQEFGAADVYPWWGTEYVIGLEPFTGRSGDGLADAVADSEALWLDPAGSATTKYTISVREEES